MVRRWVLCLMLLAGRAALAGPSEADIEAAKVHYQSGAQYYERGSYEDAIREFLEAYKLSQATALLYNISQAYEKKGDIANAREYLKKYIDTGDLEEGELPQLQEKLRAFDQKLKERPRETTKPPPVPPPRVVEPPKVAPPPPAVAPPEPVVDQGRPRRPFAVLKWVAGGAGVACVVMSTVFALDANAQQKKIEDKQGMGLPYDAELQDAYSRGQRDNTLTAVFGVAGAALLATGVVLFIVDGGASSERPSARVLPVATPDAVGAAVVYHF